MVWAVVAILCFFRLDKQLAFAAAASEDSKPAASIDASMPRIAVRADSAGAVFVIKESGAPISLKGFNYIRLRNHDHATFEAATKTTAGFYDSAAAEAMFVNLQANGYNVVRVFIEGRRTDNPGIAGDLAETSGVYAPYMDNFLDFLHRARRHHIYVFPNLDGLPLSRHYQELLGHGHAGANALYFTKEGIGARAQYLRDFVRYIADHDPASLPTMLGIECENEQCVAANQWPLTITSGKLCMPCGKTYDMAIASRRRALMNDGLAYYHAELSAAVKGAAPEMLVAEGVFTNFAVGKSVVKDEGIWPDAHKDKRYPPDLVALGNSPLDFIDLHFYRTSQMDIGESFRVNIQSSRLDDPEMIRIRQSKPVLMGEFGAFRHVEKTMEEVATNMLKIRDLASQAGLKGFIYWTYDTAEQPELFYATQGDGSLVKRLAGNAD